jgi:predicted RNase H-like nuclease (RuvC/YqgF family)
VISPRPSSTTRRKAPTSRLRRASEVVLVSGTLLAVLSLFGPGWATRAGIAVAIASAIVACVCAWRELFSAERRHARSMLAASQRHGAELRDERRRNAEVVETLTDRVQAAGRTIEGQQVTIAALRHEVFGLEGDRTSLRGALRDRDRTITSLRTTVQKQEVELGSLRTDLGSLRENLASLQEDLASFQQDTFHEDGPGDGAAVSHLPRRHRAELEAVAAVSGSEVLDLRMLETARAVLPNYEEDRRRA